MKITRRKFVKSAAAGSSLLLSSLSLVGKTQATASSAPIAKTSRLRTATGGPPLKPNVIFILADDLGWGDLSCYGRPDYRTPHIDLLAAEGTKFTDAYAASAICTPTRCGFI